MTASLDPYLPPPKRALGRVEPDPETHAAYVTGLLVAARAAREKAAHEAYNDPVALAARIEAELAAPAPEPEPESDPLPEVDPEPLPEPDPEPEPVKPQRSKRKA